MGAVIRLALGGTVDSRGLTPRLQQPVCQRHLFPSPGQVTAVRGAEEVSKLSGIAMCEASVRVGDLVAPVDSHPARAGVVIATGGTPEEALARARGAVLDIVIETELTLV